MEHLPKSIEFFYEQNHHLHTDVANVSSYMRPHTWASKETISIFKLLRNCGFFSQRFYTELATDKFIVQTCKYKTF